MFLLFIYYEKSFKKNTDLLLDLLLIHFGNGWNTPSFYLFTGNDHSIIEYLVVSLMPNFLEDRLQLFNLILVLTY